MNVTYRPPNEKEKSDVDKILTASKTSLKFIEIKEEGPKGLPWKIYAVFDLDGDRLICDLSELKLLNRRPNFDHDRI